jgi:hypothetical protein
MPTTPTVTRADVLAFRWHAQQLDRAPDSAGGPGTVDVLDLGVQDTGPDGALWALVLRGLALPRDPSAESSAGGAERSRASAWEELSLAWTLRGAPHAYRRADLARVAVATAPWSEADAAKRVINAASPLREAGIGVLDSLREIAALEREIVTEPTVKGELSTRLTAGLRPAQVRWCGPCQATHSWEMPFRLAALQGGLELEPDTSPPVLRRVPGLEPPGFAPLGGDADARFDVVRGYLRFFGPATVREVAGYVDAPPREVQAHWPADAVEVEVGDVPPTLERGRPVARWVLEVDVDTLTGATAKIGDGAGAGAGADGDARLLGPFDPYLQLRDRETLVPDEARRKELWRTLGRPGAVASGGEVLGVWRPRSSGKGLRVLVEPWVPLDDERRRTVGEAAEQLAAFRGVALVGVDGL